MLHRQAPPPLNLAEVGKLDCSGIDSGCFTLSPNDLSSPPTSHSTNRFNFEFWIPESPCDRKQENDDSSVMSATSKMQQGVLEYTDEAVVEDVVESVPFHTPFYLVGLIGSATKKKFFHQRINQESSFPQQPIRTSAAGTENETLPHYQGTRCNVQDNDDAGLSFARRHPSVADKQIQVLISDGPSPLCSRGTQATSIEQFPLNRVVDVERNLCSCDRTRSDLTLPDLILMAQSANSSHERRLVNIGLTLRAMGDRLDQTSQLINQNEQNNNPTVLPTDTFRRITSRILDWIILL